MEPGEAFEDSIKREMWEEAGVKVWDIKYHSSQPWVSEHIHPRRINGPNYSPPRRWVQPFPANLMVGFYATASESQQLRIDLDNELTGEWNRPSHFHCVHLLIRLPSDARWFTREEILAVLNHPQGTSLSSRGTSQPGDHDPPFRLPFGTAIANVLISDWANGKPLDSSNASPKL